MQAFYFNSKWKPVYDAHLPARNEAGYKEVHLLRNADDPNETIIMFDELQVSSSFLRLQRVYVSIRNLLVVKQAAFLVSR